MNLAIVTVFVAVTGAVADESVAPVAADAPVVSEGRAARVLTLDECVRMALEHQPQLSAARARSEAGRARADGALAPMLPQLSTTATYQRATANSVSRGGSSQAFEVVGLPPGVKAPAITMNTPEPTNDSYDSYNFGAQANVLLFDFGRSFTNWTIATTSADAIALQEQDSIAEIELAVRTAFFAARAQDALVTVAREALANEERHLARVDAFIEVGRRPRIDLAQAVLDRANARLRVVNAENAAAIARARLFQSMGAPSEDAGAATLSGDVLSPLALEDAQLEVLVDEARSARADIAAVDRQLRAARLALDATAASFAPTLSAGAGVSEAGQALDHLTWNWNAQVVLSWSIFSGGSTRAQYLEAIANLDELQAQAEQLRQSVRFQVEQARLGVRAARASVEASQEAVTAARERHRLADGRYAEGEGSALELSDAQLALTTAETQAVQADFDLSAARAELLRALGR